MLYTKKDVEGVYSEIVSYYIRKGARIDFSNCNYLTNEFDCHTDLITNDNTRIIVYISTGRMQRNNHAFMRNNRGMCEINVRMCKPERKDNVIYYPKSGIEELSAYKLFRYKDVYTNDEETYKIMNAIEKKRMEARSGNINRVNYNPSTILSIVRKRRGFKRTKAENIVLVEKGYKEFNIYVNTRGKVEVITIG